MTRRQLATMTVWLGREAHAWQLSPGMIPRRRASVGEVCCRACFLPSPSPSSVWFWQRPLLPFWGAAVGLRQMRTTGAKHRFHLRPPLPGARASSFEMRGATSASFGEQNGGRPKILRGTYAPTGRPRVVVRHSMSRAAPPKSSGSVNAGVRSSPLWSCLGLRRTTQTARTSG